MAQSLLDLEALLPSWELALRAERKSPGTVKSYGDGVRAYLRWSNNTKTGGISRPLAQAFVADLLAGGAEAATVHSRLKGLRLFSAWLAAEANYRTIRWPGCAAPRSTARWCGR